MIDCKDEAGGLKTAPQDKISSTKSKKFFDSIIMGDLISSCSFKCIIVLAEAWPSWVYSFGGLFTNVRLFGVCFSDLIHTKVFGGNIRWWKHEVWVQECRQLDGDSEDWLFCVQGSYKFTATVILQLLQEIKNPSLIAAIDCMFVEEFKSSPIGNWKIRYISHATCGGATRDKRLFMAIRDGRDLILEHQADSSFQLGTSVQRRLRHLVDQCQTGKALKLENYTLPIYNMDSLIPASLLTDVVVEVPTVYNKDQLIRRRLSKKEILNMKDLPLSLEQRLGRRVKGNLMKEIIKVAPSKMLWEVLCTYFTTCDIDCGKNVDDKHHSDIDESLRFLKIC